MVGGFRSEAVLAMQEVAMDYKKLFLGCGAADAKLGENVETNYDRYKYWFRVTPTKSADLGRTLFAVLASIAGQIRADLKKATPKVAIVAEKVVWTQGIVKALQANLPKMKMEVVGLWQPSPTATDVTAELSAIERAGADIVFTAVSGPVGIVLGRQMGERKMKAIAFGINVEAQKDGFWQATAGKGNFVSTLDTYGMVEVSPKMIPFVKEFEARFHKSPTYNAATYDAIMDLKIAIEKAGSYRRRQTGARSRGLQGCRRDRGDAACLGQAPRPGVGDRQELWNRGRVAGRQEGAVLAATGEGHAALQAAVRRAAGR